MVAKCDRLADTLLSAGRLYWGAGPTPDPFDDPGRWRSRALRSRSARQDSCGKQVRCRNHALKEKFGDQAVQAFVTILPFAVDDSLRIVKQKGIALPSTPNPSPQDGEALAGAVWAAGQTGHSFNVEVMFDRTLSHGIHIQVMKDIDAKYGVAQDADLHAVLNQAMHDLAVVYNFDTAGKPKSGT